MLNNHPLCLLEDAPEQLCTDFLSRPGMAFSMMVVADLTEHCGCHPQPQSAPASVSALSSDAVPGFVPRGL